METEPSPPRAASTSGEALHTELTGIDRRWLRGLRHEEGSLLPLLHPWVEALGLGQIRIVGAN